MQVETMRQTVGLASFLSQTDGVGKSILVLLLLMSLATWVLIFVKAIQFVMTRKRSTSYLKIFWNAPSLQAVGKHLDEHHPVEPFSHLTWHGLAAVRHHEQQGANKLDEAGSPAEFITRAMRRVVDEETARMESGLTVLASVGSTAPFVGLFGTVCHRQTPTHRSLRHPVSERPFRIRRRRTRHRR